MNTTTSTALVWITSCFAVIAAPVEPQPSVPLDRYDVIWDTPSTDAMGSMPLGNGDIGLNVWVEQDGDLRFYISKVGAWSERARLLKIGRVRVQFTPNPFLGSQPIVF